MCKRDATPKAYSPARHIIEDDAPAFGEIFKLADGEGFGDVEEAEENEGDQGVAQVEGAEEQGDPLAGDLVDDHELRVVAAGFAGDDGGGGDSEDDRECDGEEGEEQSVQFKTTPTLSILEVGVGVGAVNKTPELVVTPVAYNFGNKFFSPLMNNTYIAPSVSVAKTVALL